jgi:hypothetical protein
MDPNIFTIAPPLLGVPQKEVKPAIPAWPVKQDVKIDPPKSDESDDEIENLQESGEIDIQKVLAESVDELIAKNQAKKFQETKDEKINKPEKDEKKDVKPEKKDEKPEKIDKPEKKDEKPEKDEKKDVKPEKKDEKPEKIDKPEKKDEKPEKIDKPEKKDEKPEKIDKKDEKLKDDATLIKNKDSWWIFIDDQLADKKDKTQIIKSKLGLSDRVNFTIYLKEEIQILKAVIQKKNVFGYLTTEELEKKITKAILKGSAYSFTIKEDPEFLTSVN